MFNKTRNNIENRLSNNNNKVSLNQYVDDLLLPYSNNGTEPNFEDILEQRKIIGPIVNNNISTDAYIKLENNQFVLTTKSQLDYNNPVDRLLFAHEVAHTFLYTIKSNTILDTFLFSKSSLEQEYFCDFFARAYLIPSIQLKEDLKEFETLSSLKFLNKLSLKYNVPYQEIIKRILNDLELFKGITIIRFVKFSDSLNWKIFETFMSESIRFDKTYYIPKNNFKKEVKYQDRFPTCSDILSYYLDKMYNEMTFNEEFEIEFEIDEKLNEKPLKQFAKNLKENSTYLMTKTENKTYNNKLINLMVKL